MIETIEALAPAVSGETCEMVIADRLEDELTSQIRRDYPHVRLMLRGPGNALAMIE